MEIQKDLAEAKEKAERSLSFCLKIFKDDDDSMEFYTGFTYSTFCVIYNLLDPGLNGENIDLYTKSKCASSDPAQNHKDHSYCDPPPAY